MIGRVPQVWKRLSGGEVTGTQKDPDMTDPLENFGFPLRNEGTIGEL